MGSPSTSVGNTNATSGVGQEKGNHLKQGQLALKVFHHVYQKYVHNYLSSPCFYYIHVGAILSRKMHILQHLRYIQNKNYF